MPSRRPDGSRVSGAEQRKRAKGGEAAATFTGLPPEILGLLPPPPTDPVDLQVWGAQCSAQIAYILLSPGTKIPLEVARLIKDYLATMGLLFPRAHLVDKLQKAKAARQKTAADKDVTPRAGIPPGPGSRRRGSQ